MSEDKEDNTLQGWAKHIIDSGWSFAALHTTIYQALERITQHRYYSFSVTDQPSGVRLYALQHSHYGELATIQLREVELNTREVRINPPARVRLKELLRGATNSKQRFAVLQDYVQKRNKFQHEYNAVIEHFLAIFDEDTGWRDDLRESETSDEAKEGSKLQVKELPGKGLRESGPTAATDVRFQAFSEIKADHPEYTQDDVARVYSEQFGELIGSDAVRNAYRGMKVKWKRGKRKR